MISLIYGGITHHYIAHNLNYCNSINSVGTIHNQYVIAMAGTSKARLGVLAGRDSACGRILGPISSFRVSENVDLMLGGYNTNFNSFKARGIESPSIYGITPVVGLDFKISLIKTDTFRVDLDNLVSVGIVTHAISVSF